MDRPPTLVREPSCAARRRQGRRATTWRAAALPEDQWERLPASAIAPNGRTALKDYLIANGRQAGRAGRRGPADRAGGRRRSPTTGSATGSSSRSPTRRGRIVSLRRPGHGSRRPRQIPERAGEPRSSTRARPLYGLPEARKLLHAPQAAATAETPIAGGRGLYGRHRLPAGGHAGGGADGHGPDRGADGACCGGCHPEPTLVLRRRQGGPVAPPSRHRPGAAAAEARPIVPLRPAGPAARTPTTCCASSGAPALRQPLAADHGRSSRPCSHREARPPSRWTPPSARPGFKAAAARRRPRAIAGQGPGRRQYRRELFERLRRRLSLRAVRSRPRAGRATARAPMDAVASAVRRRCLRQTAEGAQAMQSLQPLDRAGGRGPGPRQRIDDPERLDDHLEAIASPRLRRSGRWMDWRRR